MNREDIIRMAREATKEAPREDWNSTAWVFGDETLERFAALVIANHPPQSYMTWQEGYEAGKHDERSACANLVDHILKEGGGTWGDAIRARGQA
jgi:hypothetical protein